MKKFDVYAIGNALVDSEYEVSDHLLAQAGVAKRHMTLIDTPRRAELLHHMQGLRRELPSQHRDPRQDPRHASLPDADGVRLPERIG